MIGFRDVKGVLARRAILGLYLLLTLYYLATVLGIPASVTTNRVVRFVALNAFLLHEPVYDILLLIAFAIGAYVLGLPRACALSLIPVALVPLIQVAGLPSRYQYVPLLASSLIPIAVSVRRWLRDIVIGFSLIVIPIEVVAASLHVYSMISGRELPHAALMFVLRERALWALAEWVAISMIVITSVLSLVLVLNKGIRKHIAPVGRAINTAVGGRHLHVKPSLGLAVGLATAVLLVVLPHLPTFNPLSRPVSVDTYYYTKFLNLASREGVARALREFHLFRPTYLAIVYLAYRASGLTPYMLMDVVHPLVAFIAIVVAAWYVSGKVLGREASGIVAILTPLSYTLITFVSGGFHSNTVALPLAILTISLTPSLRGYVALYVLSTLTALIHPWTFIMYSIAYVIYRWRVRGDPLKVLAITAALLVTALASSEAVSNAITPASGPLGAMGKAMSTGVSAAFPKNIVDGIELWDWGTLSNPQYLLVASIPTQVTTPFLALLALAIPVFKDFMVHRVLLNLPLYLGAAVVLRRVDRVVALALMVGMLARVLGQLSGLTPLEGPIWSEILMITR